MGGKAAGGRVSGRKSSWKKSSGRKILPPAAAGGSFLERELISLPLGRAASR